jgi:integrase
VERYRFRAAHAALPAPAPAGQVAGAPKNQGRRPLDLAEPEAELLREHRRAQDELRLAQGPRWEAHDLVFCTDRGRPLGHRNVSREFKKFVARAGLPDIRFHDLRHSNATLLAAAGVPLKVIQERLGHTDSRTTLGFYGHTTPAMGKEAAQKLRELLHDG